MDLFLIRHAVAEDGDDDDARPLSAKGDKRFRQVVGGLERLEVRFDHVLHSPKLRAVQTAELLAPLADGAFEVTPLLARAPDEKLLARLDGDAVAAVGHEPHLSALLAWLTVGDDALGHAFELKKGAVAHLAGAPVPGGMRLVALYPPSTLRELA